MQLMSEISTVAKEINTSLSRKGEVATSRDSSTSPLRLIFPTRLNGDLKSEEASQPALFINESISDSKPQTNVINYFLIGQVCFFRFDFSVCVLE